MRNGCVYERPTSVLPMAVTAGSWLPTPLASDGEKGGPNQRGGSGDLRLSSAVHLLPTPAARDGEPRGSQHPDARKAGGHQVNLNDVAEHLLPTAMDMGRGRTPEEWDDWRGEMRERHGNGNGHGRSLEIEAQRLLPTPTAMDAHGSRGYRPDGTPYTGTAGVTLTDAALSSSGAHTAPRSPAGNESSDGELPGQLSLDAAASD